MSAPLVTIGSELAAALAELGPVEEAEHGADLLSRLSRAESPPELVVIGTSASLAEGASLTPLEILRGLQGLYGFAAPPTIVAVPPGQEQSMAELLGAGAADVVLSPWRAPDLLARAAARRRGSNGTQPQARVLDASVLREALAQPVTAKGGALFGLTLVVSELSQTIRTRVFKGVRLEDGTLSALKVLDPDVAVRDEDLAGRFAREQQILLEVEHPNLVPIRSAGTLGGLRYLDMDFVVGEPLRDRVARLGSIPVEEAVRIACEVARGLAALHERGIVHRDIKPENILIDREGRARLCDFGLSKAQNDAGLTREGEILGTVAFIAPEVLCGTAPAFHSDVYALGITIFELVTGQDAIESGTPDHMFRQAVQGAAQQQAMKELPDKVRPVVSRMLAVDPGDRYDRLEDLIADLERTLAG
ncbi:MAG TPA: hypothetical protein DEA08_29135 [Planctomycetes bacterium]|nr:hypothetical protein [Planctomycetota bacterium]